MDPSIDLEIDIALRGNHYVATCARFPGSVGAGTTEAAATEALIASIMLAFETAESSAAFRPQMSETARPHKSNKRALSILLVAVVVSAIGGFGWMFLGRNELVTDQMPNAIKTAENQSQPSSSPNSLTEINSGIPAPTGIQQGLKTAEPPPIFAIEHLKPILRPAPDYDALYENASRCQIQAISKLYSDSMKGIAAAQVRWARLLEVWGYRRESRAWARQLSGLVDEEDADFLANLALLCLELGSLQEFASNQIKDLSRGKVFRNPREVHCVRELHQRANNGSIPACIALAEFYCQTAKNSFVKSREEKEEFERNEQNWRVRGLSKFVELGEVEMLPISCLRKIMSLTRTGRLGADPATDPKIYLKASNALNQIDKFSTQVATTNERPRPTQSSVKAIKEMVEELLSSVDACADLQPVRDKVMAGLLLVQAREAHSKLRTLPLEMMTAGKLFNDLKETDMDLIFGLVERSYRLGHIEAVANLWFLLDGMSASVSGNALSLLSEAAEAGDLSAQLDLAGDIDGRIAGLIEANEKINGPEKKSRSNFYLTDPVLKTARSERHGWSLRAAKQGHYDSQIELRSSSDWDIKFPEGPALAQCYFWYLISLRSFETNPNDFCFVVHTPDENDKLSLAGYAARLSKEFNIDPSKVEDAALKFEPHPEIVFAMPKLPRQSPGSGTGFFVGPNLFVTNAHVVGSWRKVQVYPLEETAISGIVVHVDEDHDLAVVLLDGYQTDNWLSLSESQAVKLSSQVFTIGFPNPDIQGVEPKYTDGKVSSLSGIADDPRFYQVTIPVQPGNSGGPLVDHEGQVVGVVSARLGDIATFRDTGALPQNVNYAVKIEYLLPMLRELGIVLPTSKHEEDYVEKARRSVARVLTGED